VNATPVIATAFGLVKVTVSSEDAPCATPVGEKALATVGGSNTVSVAAAELAFVPPLVVSPPAGKVLV
jgi:hypothetical protein